jgi:DNA-binding transcriptional LysR family regulator
LATPGDLFTGVLPFFHTAQERSFRRAAERLGVTPAAVSKAVLRLEEELGVKLLVRTSRTVSLTPEGSAFLERCREAILSVQTGRELLTQARKAPRGELRVTLPFILGNLVVPRMATLSARYPELSFRVAMTDRPLRLAEEGVDVAVRIGVPADSGLIGRHLRDSRWVTVGAPTYVARRGPPSHPGDLAGHNCLHFVAPDGRPREWTFLEPASGEARPTRVEGNFSIDHGEHLLAAAVSGLGLCQVLDFMVEEHLREGRLVEVLASYSAAGPPIYALCTAERRRSPNVTAFLAFLAEVFLSAPARPRGGRRG